jgi:uncharacterized membrane protein YuzA (DUF378 family)
MLNKIPFKFAIQAMLVILSSVILFHILVLTEIIPFTIVWGGKFQNLHQMRIFEGVSIIINALMIAVIAIKGRIIKLSVSVKIINLLLWLFIGLFVLNTVGNLFAKTTTETIIFTPITFVSAILCFIIVMNDKKTKE